MPERAAAPAQAPEEEAGIGKWLKIGQVRTTLLRLIALQTYSRCDASPPFFSE